MSPDERQMLSGLFDRIRAVAGTARDRDAEVLINDQVRAQPYAPYLLAQTVLMQEQTLQQAAARVQQLEAQVQELQSRPAPVAESTSFLGGIGKSIFGGSAPATPRPTSVPNYAPQPSANPWGQPQPQMQQPQMMGQPMQPQMMQPAQRAGGGFLSGALTTAAGVAGGMMLANSLSGVFGGHHNSGGGLFGGGDHTSADKTGVNNYTPDSAPAALPSPEPEYQAQHDPGSYQAGATYDTASDYSNDSGSDSGSYDA